MPIGYIIEALLWLELTILLYQEKEHITCMRLYEENHLGLINAIVDSLERGRLYELEEVLIACPNKIVEILIFDQGDIKL